MCCLNTPSVEAEFSNGCQAKKLGTPEGSLSGIYQNKNITCKNIKVSANLEVLFGLSKGAKPWQVFCKAEKVRGDSECPGHAGDTLVCFHTWMVLPVLPYPPKNAGPDKNELFLSGQNYIWFRRSRGDTTHGTVGERLFIPYVFPISHAPSEERPLSFSLLSHSILLNIRCLVLPVLNVLMHQLYILVKTVSH